MGGNSSQKDKTVLELTALHMQPKVPVLGRQDVLRKGKQSALSYPMNHLGPIIIGTLIAATVVALFFWGWLTLHSTFMH